MKIYHSAFTLSENYIHLLEGKKVYILRSFYGSKKTDCPLYCNGVFLDSGAFSALRSGVDIDLNVYIDFLKEHSSAFDVYANLDVIGNAKATLINQKKMDAVGLTPIPTFHYGENFKYLELYIKNYPYIALGGMVPLQRGPALSTWLDVCWKKIGKAKIKVHGFGLTDLELMQSYPWYSVDSTTASRAGRIGVLITPWGQLRVSTGIKEKAESTIHTPLKIIKVLNWVKEFTPNLVSSWEQISAPTKEASQLRIIINALYIESEAAKTIERKNLRVTGFFDK